MDTKYNPKQYFDNSNTLEWGKNLTKKQILALKNGEIFTLNDKNGKPIRKILMDSYNQIREPENNHIIIQNKHLLIKAKDSDV